MARLKDKPKIDLVEGFSFGDDSDTNIESTPNVEEKPSTSIQNDLASLAIDPDRAYSKYYSPHPKKGKLGGVLGRPSVEKSSKKIQFSVTCTPSQKETYMEYAKNTGRTLPSLIILALDEYIESHKI